MALLFMEGFGGGDANFKWDITSSTYTATSTSPRIAGCFYGNGGATQRSFYKTITASAQVIVGFGAYMQSGETNYVSFWGDGGTTQHITVMRNTTTGVIQIRRGSTSGTVVASGTQPIFDSQWNYIEVSCTISDTVGEVHVRLNGKTTDEVSFTGDTKNAGTATTIDRVHLSIGQSGNYISDVYVLDGTGPAPNNTFLGDVVVRTLSPAGNGNYSQLVGSDSDSVNNYLLVDEHPYSGTDYVGSATTGQKDSYAMADLPGGVSTVYGLQLNGLMAKSDASLAQARLLLRSGGTDFGGVTRALTTTFTGYYELYENNPATSAQWTPGQVNSMESGMEVM